MLDVVDGLDRKGGILPKLDLMNRKLRATVSVPGVCVQGGWQKEALSQFVTVTDKVLKFSKLGTLPGLALFDAQVHHREGRDYLLKRA